MEMARFPVDHRQCRKVGLLGPLFRDAKQSCGKGDVREAIHLAFYTDPGAPTV
jgi:hypothetical protein